MRQERVLRADTNAPCAQNVRAEAALLGSGARERTRPRSITLMDLYGLRESTHELPEFHPYEFVSIEEIRDAQATSPRAKPLSIARHLGGAVEPQSHPISAVRERTQDAMCCSVLDQAARFVVKRAH